MFEEVTVEYNRYVYIFTEEITSESVQSLIDVLVGVPSVDLYFCTIGGELPWMNALVHFINNHPDINIYLTGWIASAGTLLLTDCEKPVYLTDDLDWILFHVADRDFGGKFRKEKLNQDVLYDQLKTFNTKFADKFKKLGLNSKEIKSILNGDDVILYQKDFNRLKVNRK